MNFIEKLRTRWESANSVVCVGLDSDEDLIPDCVQWKRDSVLEFNKAIIDATASLVCAYKLNYAFYAGAKRIQREVELKETIDYIHENYPEIPIILDGKFGDIGNTSKKYAYLAFEKYKADAVTVNPYLGQDAIQPFLDYKDKGVFVLCKTSNPGSVEFQDEMIVRHAFFAQPLYSRVARQVAKSWNKNGNCGLVVGATYPKQLKEIRRIVGNLPILVPGIGTQAGDLEKVIKYGLDITGFGLVVNSSRKIIYASKEKDFAQASLAEARSLRDQINEIKKSLRR